MTATCRTCNAPVIWVKTMAGKNHPLDETPDPEGKWVIQPSAMGDMMVGVSSLTDDQPKYTSHFATCPQADQHRKQRWTRGDDQ